MLKTGDQVPFNINLTDSQGQSVSLADYTGQWIVVYFYPQDDTPGCTIQACSFRDSNNDIQDLGVQIIGISPDQPLSHSQFIDKYQLNFPLWSDPDHHLMSAFGSWGLKKNYGKEYIGVIRSTFIINPQGQIAKVWKKAIPKTNSQQVLDFLTTHLA